MATYVKVPRSVPGDQRSAEITDVAAGDQIDLVEILGKPAKRVKFVLTADTDVVDYKINHLRRLLQHNESSADSTILVWSGAAGYPEYIVTGAEEVLSVDGLEIASIEIVAVTLSVGTTIELVIW